ncbi:MAG: metallophosphoesterase [Bacillota bacterium]|nr:metallophosphoesterase [Bacillota bacterium]
MNKKITIAQISDIHIPRPDQQVIQGDTRKKFTSILESICQDKPDFLVLTGDLCLWEGSVKVYQWIKERLDQTGLKYYIIAGNHDDVSLLAQVFNYNDRIAEDELYYSAELGNLKVVFLDSSKGSISDKQLNWLQQQERIEKQQLVVFTHYPPVRAQVSFMDNNFPLVNQEEVLKALLKDQVTVNYFCGHYHVEKSIVQDSLKVHICPSTYFQMNQQANEFQVEHYYPGWRKIVFEDNKLITNVQYVFGQFS